MSIQVEFDLRRLEDFSRRWKVTELSMFGSALRGDFDLESDVDLLVEFEKNAPWSMLDWPTMMDELAEIFGRNVDLVEKAAIRNPFRRQSVLSSRKIIYAA